MDKSCLLTPQEAAEVLRTTPGALAQHRRRGTGPEFVRAGERRVLYRVEAIENWLREGA